MEDHLTTANTKKPVRSLLIFLTCLIIVGGISISNIRAQRNDSIQKAYFEEIRNEIESVLNSYLDESYIDRPYGSPDLLNPVFDFSYAYTHSQEFYDSLYEAESQYLRQDFGLSFQASYVENFGNLGFDEGFFYRRRFQAGVNWDALKEGFYARKVRQEKLALRKELETLQREADLKGMNYRYLFNGIIKLFNREKLVLLRKRKAFLYQQLSYVKKIYYLKYTSWEEVMDLKSRQKEVENQLKNYQSYNAIVPEGPMDRLRPEKMPLYDILPRPLESAIYGKALQDSIIGLQQALIELEKTPWDKFSVRATARYNLFDNRFDTPDRDFFSAGLSIGFPLPLGNKSEGKMLELKQQQLDSDFRQTRKSEWDEIIALYYEYQYILQDYISFSKKEAKLVERIRRENTKRSLGDPDFSPLAVAELMDQLFQVKLEMIDIKQRSYLKLLKIHSFTETTPPSEYLVLFRKENFLQKYRTERSVYLWSGTFAEFENKFLVEYIKYNEFSTVMLSIGKDETLIPKAINFTETLNENGISVHLMIGENKLLKESSSLELDTRLRLCFTIPVDGVHLDVEPHVLEDWDLRRDWLENQYKSILYTSALFAEANGLDLSVSIPVHYEQSLLEEVYENADKVMLMAYEHPDVAYIDRKVKEEMAIAPEKTVIALSHKDFQNRYLMENFMTELSSSKGFNQFALHDLKGLIELEEKALDTEE